VATTPRPTKLIRELLAREARDIAVTRGSTCENRARVSPRRIPAISVDVPY
jgi:hypothetical protein